jgi:VWFA-related protein
MTRSSNILHRLLLVTSILLLLTLGTDTAQVQDARAQTPQTPEIRLLLTAIDKDSHLVTTIRAEDLRILEDGIPQQIIGFEQIKDSPLSLAILIDASGSQERTLPSQKFAAASFVDSIIQTGKDEAAVASFTGTLKVQQKLTSDVTLLRRAIERVQFVPPPGYAGGAIVIGQLPPMSRTPVALAGATAIWDAVFAACEDLLSQSIVQTRRAIVLLSDGEDNISQRKMSDAINRANRDHVTIYSVGIGDTAYGLNKDALRQLSERTGGRAFFPKKVGDLSAIFTHLGEELRAQYAFSYKPTKSVAASASRKIRIEIVNPALRSANLELAYQRTVVR